MSIEDVKTDKHKQTADFNMSAVTCVDKIKGAINDMRAVVTSEDEKRYYMIADNFQNVFRSSIDTTQVGILVTPTAPDKCRVEVASGNIDLAVFVLKELVKKIGG